MRRKRLRATAVAALAAAALTAAAVQPAAAAGYRPVETHFSTGFVTGFLFPGQSPPGADDWNCRPGSAHPNPVVLVHGTLENRNDNWRGAAPLLANQGYCVYSFNYGGPSGGSPVQGTGAVADGARTLAGFVDRVLAATGAAEADLVGHSQGGMLPRYYLKNLGGAAKVGKLIGLAPSNNGTTLDGLTELGRRLHLLEPANDFLSGPCQACVDQEIGSPFLTELNAGGGTVPGVEYTVIATRYDEVVTPWTNAFLPAGPHVTNILVQDQCALDATDHLEIAYDPVALTDVLNALDPAHPRPIPCQVVLPVTGPLL
ncbi:esterase/lipase family protein [Kitasatospora sp. NPDC059646]|uniref:esterase/lipase family protein n=1 Tax=Kitasatospora sp. NPDC059646 TaxID=3346893 RepID=UPI00369D517D